MTEAIALPAALSLGTRPARLFSDDRLVHRAKKGDKRALAAIYDRYHQDLHRYCQAILGNPEDAEDALQNTMVKALRALPGEEREIKLKPWLYRIAHNEAIEVTRRRPQAARIDEQSAPSTESGPHQSIETQERLRQLIRDLGELPERQRSALVLRELSGMNFAEIGATLNATPAAARQTIYEARTNLQQMSEGREMSCESARQAISGGDGRVLRRRDIRAHLRACASCAEFKTGIATRRQDLASLGPLPAAASAGLLHVLLGGSHGGSGTAGLAGALSGGAGKALATSTLLKSAAAVVAVTAVGVTAADRGGLMPLGSGVQSKDSPAQSSSAPPAVTGPSASSDTTFGLESPGAARARGPDQASAPSGQKAEGHDSAVAAPDNQLGDPTESSATPSSDGSQDALPTAASHGQETAAAHQPQLPAAAQNHPTPAHHPGPPASPPSKASPPAPPHPAHPSPPAASNGAGNAASGSHGAPGH